MSIQFKFKSTMDFHTVEIGNRASISVGELRSYIMKRVFQQQGFDDLVFYDASSGLEFESDDSQIPGGSSVIVKRVPGGTGRSAVLPEQAVKNVATKKSHNLNPVNGPMDEFDVLGAEFCPMPGSNFPDFKQEYDQTSFKGNKDEVTGLRLESKNLKPSKLDKAVPGGLNQHENDGNILPKFDEHLKLNKLPNSNILAAQIELKCSLCNNFFEDAVMLPCCQHSFCEKCIHQVLLGKGTCPKCFSRKCRVGDMIPNLSLRGAISHLLISQMLDTDLENRQKDVPDRESGTQAPSRVLPVVQMDLELPRLSCATEKGSNQVSMEPLYDQNQWRSMAYWNSGLQSQKANQLNGENQPVLPQAKVHDEADSSINRREGFWIASRGAERDFLNPGGHKKGVRNCYTCGSPDHLMRDCPMSHSNLMFQPGNGVFNGGMPGYAAPYWNYPSVPPYATYANLYSSPTMMPFSASLYPVSPVAFPPYILSMHGSLPAPGVNMTMKNMEPPCPENFGLQQCRHKRRHS